MTTIVPKGWINNLFFSKDNKYNGYFSEIDNNFYYTELRNPTTFKIGMFDKKTENLTIINDTIQTNIQLYTNSLNIEQIKETITSGTKLEGGKSRNWVKTDGSVVVKTNGSAAEYECSCKCYILGIPLNPPLVYIESSSKDESNMIVEKMIKSNSHTDDFIKCYYDASLYNNLNIQFNNLIEKLKLANIGGDFKLDNILFNEDGSFILTDFSMSCMTWDNWVKIALREEGDIDMFLSFKKRLDYYLTQLLNEGVVIWVPMRKTKEVNVMVGGYKNNKKREKTRKKKQNHKKNHIKKSHKTKSHKTKSHKNLNC